MHREPVPTAPNCLGGGGSVTAGGLLLGRQEAWVGGELPTKGAVLSGRLSGGAGGWSLRAPLQTQCLQRGCWGRGSGSMGCSVLYPDDSALEEAGSRPEPGALTGCSPSIKQPSLLGAGETGLHVIHLDPFGVAGQLQERRPFAPGFPGQGPPRGGLYYEGSMLTMPAGGWQADGPGGVLRKPTGCWGHLLLPGLAGQQLGDGVGVTAVGVCRTTISHVGPREQGRALAPLTAERQCPRLTRRLCRPFLRAWTRPFWCPSVCKEFRVPSNFRSQL